MRKQNITETQQRKNFYAENISKKKEKRRTRRSIKYHKDAVVGKKLIPRIKKRKKTKRAAIRKTNVNRVSHPWQHRCIISTL